MDIADAMEVSKVGLNALFFVNHISINVVIKALINTKRSNLPLIVSSKRVVQFFVRYLKTGARMSNNFQS